MSKKSCHHQTYSPDFKLRIPQEYYESGSSKYGINKKYGPDSSVLSRWLRKYESKSLSLPKDLLELKNQVHMVRKAFNSKTPTSSSAKNEVETLREEIQRLHKALAYSELRNEAFHEVLRISRERYGIDLLKKAGAK